MAKRIISNQNGFTIIEVLVALTIFAIFAVTMTLTQTTNKDRSTRMAQDLEIHNLAVMKMNEVLLRVNEFTNASDKTPETGEIKIEGYEKYKYTIEYKKNEFPDFSGLMGTPEEDNRAVDPNAAVKKVIFDKMKRNVEEMLWQVKVTIEDTTPRENKEGKTVPNRKYELNSWVEKNNAQIDTNFGF